MKIGYSINDIVPKAMMESKTPNAKLGYNRHLMECVGRRVVLEGTALVNSTLNRIADKTIEKLQSQGSGDAIGFNALSALYDRLGKIRDTIKKQYVAEKDSDTRQALANAYVEYQLFHETEKDKILLKALKESKTAQGNRLITFVKSILMQISSTSKTPILDFKHTVTTLRSNIIRVLNTGSNGALSSYKDALIGSDGLVDTLDSIVDEFIASESEINQIMNPSYTSPSNTNDANSVPADAFTGHQTNHMYESQVAFMEAFAESLSYFSRKKV